MKIDTRGLNRWTTTSALISAGFCGLVVATFGYLDTRNWIGSAITGAITAALIARMGLKRARLERLGKSNGDRFRSTRRRLLVRVAVMTLPLLVLAIVAESTWLIVGAVGFGAVWAILVLRSENAG
jgi:hypothetical protein